jgi:hypothetical protein
MSPGQAGIGGFNAPTADDPNTALGQINSGSSGSGGMNWAGLSSGLSNLSKSLGSGSSSGSSDSTAMQGSRSVAPNPGGTGTPSPAGGGSGAAALANADAARQQLAQYLILAAMQGKGRSGGGKGLLG